ncbi:hypothetical protein [Halioxenophilus sp. WMMB6]|uniref:hypothetical protein n=1 Tax=Halioxenophilus sp. WMMB6 TaxID=3073815 RepID=UPI00295EDB4D|nr:hypothetical protein [Halioxenophilus sp. WMMB6]
MAKRYPKLPRRQIITLLLLIASAGLCSANSHALSPEFEADRLILQAEEQVAKEHYDTARAALREIENLGVALPDTYYYLHAKVLADEKQYSAALQSLEIYIEKRGRTGEYYEDALKQVTTLRKLAKNHNSSNKKGGQADIQWSENLSETNDYRAHLQYIYHASDPAEALLLHINNLLEFYGYGDKDIQSASRINGTYRFKLVVAPPATLVTTKRSIHQDGQHITSDRLVVYGVNPYVDYTCRSSDRSCMISNPVTHEPWLQIVQNDQAAKELSKALAELIKLLQSQG